MAMEDADQEALGSADESREPSLEDLAELCRHLNEAEARYIVVGGFAIMQAGYPRRTMDIDLLVETTLENEAKLKSALMALPDQAIRDLNPGELNELGVIRVADEFVVDLMKSGCGVDYASAVKDAVWREVLGVRIPFASKATLWRMKQTVREKDAPDRLFLRQSLKEEGIEVDDQLRSVIDPPAVPRWLMKLLRILFPPKN